MRDEKDPGTAELPLRRRAGRPAKFPEGPMTAAQRARQYRIRRKYANVGAARPLTEWTDVQLLDELRCYMRIDDGKSCNFTLNAVLREIARRHPERDADSDD